MQEIKVTCVLYEEEEFVHVLNTEINIAEKFEIPVVFQANKTTKLVEKVYVVK